MSTPNKHWWLAPEQQKAAVASDHYPYCYLCVNYGEEDVCSSCDNGDQFQADENATLEAA